MNKLYLIIITLILLIFLLKNYNNINKKFKLISLDVKKEKLISTSLNKKEKLISTSLDKKEKLTLIPIDKNNNSNDIYWTLPIYKTDIINYPDLIKNRSIPAENNQLIKDIFDNLTNDHRSELQGNLNSLTGNDNNDLYEITKSYGTTKFDTYNFNS